MLWSRMLSALTVQLAFCGSAHAAFSYEDCEHYPMTELTNAINELGQMLELVQSVIELVYSGRNQDFSAPPMSSADGEQVIAFWFGQNTTTGINEALSLGQLESPFTYIKGVFDRIWAMYLGDGFTVRCLPQNLDKCAGKLAYHHLQIKKHDTKVFVTNPRVALCPGAFTFQSALPSGSDYDLEYADWAMDPFQSLAHTILSELVHFPKISRDKIISEVWWPFPYHTSSDMDSAHEWMVTGARELALQSTFLAMHNPDNYASFAIELAMVARNVPRPALLSPPTQPQLKKPDKQLKSLSSQWSLIDQYSKTSYKTLSDAAATIVVTSFLSPTPWPTATKGLTAATLWESQIVPVPVHTPPHRTNFTSSTSTSSPYLKSVYDTDMPLTWSV